MFSKLCSRSVARAVELLGRFGSLPVLLDEARSAKCCASILPTPTSRCGGGHPSSAPPPSRGASTQKPDTRDAKSAFERRDDLAALWREIPPSARVRELALRLLRIHPLRTADALQLAAALVAAEDSPATLGFVCLDDRLSLAARREGFTVVP